MNENKIIINSSNVGEVIKSFKTTIDPDSMIYIFEDIEPFCISREYMYEQIIDSEGKVHSIYIDIIQKYIAYNRLLRKYYKNKDGLWINMDKIQLNTTTSEDIYSLANNRVYYEPFIIDAKYIPACNFTDSDGRVHPIYKGDGVSYERIENVYINESNSNTIKVSQYNIDKPTELGTEDHLKNDLKVEFLNGSAPIGKMLIWLNGMFVDYEIKNSDPDNIIYLRDAKRFLTTLPFTKDDSERPIYYYNVDLRIFMWEGVGVSQVIPTRFTKMVNVVSGQYAMGIINEIYFEEEINPNAHLVFVNGRVLTKKEYKLDPENKKHIYLTAIKQECEEMIRIIKEDEYFSGDPFILIAGLYKNNIYTLVNFSNSDSLENRELYLERSKPLISGFPSKYDILFRDIRARDLVTVNGIYFPYILSPLWYIQYPIENFIYISESFNNLMKNCNIEKIDFFREKTIVESIKMEKDPNIPPMPEVKNDGFDVDHPTISDIKNG